MTERQQKMVLENQPLITFCIKHYGLYGDYEELSSIGMIGLCKGVISYSENKNCKLSVYLMQCIRNEIYMYFRKKQASNSKVVSLNTQIDENITLEDVIKDNVDIEKIVMNKIRMDKIKEFMNKLSEKERLVLIHTYEIDGAEKLTQKQLSKILNINQSYVSIILKRAIKKIKMIMEGE